MDSEIAWEDCIPDLPLDTQELPPLNALSSSSTPSALPNIDLLDLLSFDSNSNNANNNNNGGTSPNDQSHSETHLTPTPATITSSPHYRHPHHQLHKLPDSPPSPESLSPPSLSRCTSPELPSSPPQKPFDPHLITSSPPPSVLSSTSTPPSQSSITTAPPSPPPQPVTLATHSIAAGPVSSSLKPIPVLTPTAATAPSTTTTTTTTTNAVAAATTTGTAPATAAAAPTSTSAPTVSTLQQQQFSQQDNNSQAEVVLELSTRLASATAEASALRKRVASLTSENRSLRGALDHANARLVAVAQAASAAGPHPHHHPHAHPQSTSTTLANPNAPMVAGPMMLGLTRMTADAASRFGAALTVSDVSRTDGCGGAASGSASSSPANSPPDRKKRKRVTGAATTMACVMFLWGALVGSPGWLSSTTSTRSDANLPAVWKRESTSASVPAVPSSSSSRRTATGGAAGAGGGAVAQGSDSAWLPNCMRVLEPLPAVQKQQPTIIKEEPQPLTEEPMTDDKDDEDNDDERDQTRIRSSSSLAHDAARPAKRIKTEHSGMFVDVRDREAAATVRRTDAHDPRHPQYSYVLCRDAQKAMDSVRSCAARMRRGETCGAPHTISLILPAQVVDGNSSDGVDDSSSSSSRGASHPPGTPVLAEVQCAVMSVARIPVEHTHGKGSATATAGGPTSSGSIAKYGRIIATMPETATVVRE